MDRPPSPDPCTDRIAQATARVNAAMARVSQAQETLTEAKERLARARLALKYAKSQAPRSHPRMAPETGDRYSMKAAAP
jgi:multidrug resistance efflux pump